MRRLSTLVLLVGLTCTFVRPATAQTTNVAVNLREHTSVVGVYGTVSFGLDSTGTYRTQAIQIADANQGTAFVKLTTNNPTGTETVTVSAEVSNDLVNWDTFGTIVTGVSSSAVTYDTLSTVTGNSKPFRSARFIRLVATGASGNRRGVILRWEAVLPKNVGAATSGTARVVSY